MSLIQQLLQVDPSKRIDAASALQHPWMTSSSNTPIVPQPMKAPATATASAVVMHTNAAGPDSMMALEVDPNGSAMAISPVKTTVRISRLGEWRQFTEICVQGRRKRKTSTMDTVEKENDENGDDLSPSMVSAVKRRKMPPRVNSRQKSNGSASH